MFAHVFTRHVLLANVMLLIFLFSPSLEQAAWLAMAAAEVDGYRSNSYAKYSVEERAAMREAFYAKYLKQERMGWEVCQLLLLSCIIVVPALYFRPRFRSNQCIDPWLVRFNRNVE